MLHVVDESFGEPWPLSVIVAGIALLNSVHVEVEEACGVEDLSGFIGFVDLEGIGTGLGEGSIYNFNFNFLFVVIFAFILILVFTVTVTLIVTLIFVPILVLVPN